MRRLFGSVKMDDCGAQKNMTRYASLMKAQGRSVAIENHKKPEHEQCGKFDNSSCPSLSWCPYNWYRTSHDINNSSGSWFSNLQSVIPLTELGAPLSRPHCWAYPGGR
jgi:hypothetical protein